MIAYRQIHQYISQYTHTHTHIYTLKDMEGSKNCVSVHSAITQLHNANTVRQTDIHTLIAD